MLNHAAKGLRTGYLMMLALSLAVSAHAYFMDMANGVRPEGMGEAFVAVANDANAILFNPAGFAHLGTLELTGMYSDLYSNLNARLYNQEKDRFGYNLIGAGIPIKEINGGLGIGWTQFYTVFYQENVVSLAYGRRLWEPYVLDMGWTVDVGISVKAMQWQVQVDNNTDPSDINYFSPSERGKYGFTGDVGVLVSPFENFTIGASSENIVPTDVGLTVTEYVPTIVRLGAAYDINWNTPVIDSLLVSLEVSERNRVYLPKLGLESWWLHQMIAVRAGVNSDQFSSGVSFQYAWDPSLLAMQFDYAFSYPFRIVDTAGSHRVGMTIRWGATRKQTDADVEKAMEVTNKANSVIRARMIAREAEKSAQKALQELEAAMAAGNPETIEIAKSALAKSEEAAQTAALAAEVARASAVELSEIIVSMAQEAQQAAQTARDTTKSIAALLNKVQTQANTPVAQPVIQVEKAPVIPEKNIQKIVIGLENKVVFDFGNVREVEPAIQALGMYLKKASTLDVEWRFLTPAELQLAFRQGELDFVVAYEADLDRYIRFNLLKPVATVRNHNQTSQACVLLVRENDPIKSPSDLKGKRLGYSNSRLLGELGQDFFNTGANYATNTYFASTSKQKNVRDSLWALQMEAVDAVVEYAYIQEVSRKFPEIKVRKIAESKPRENSPIYMRVSQSKAKNEQMQRLVTALETFVQDPSAQRFIQMYPIDGFVPSEGGK